MDCVTPAVLLNFPSAQQLALFQSARTSPDNCYCSQPAWLTAMTAAHCAIPVTQIQTHKENNGFLPDIFSLFKLTQTDSALLWVAIIIITTFHLKVKKKKKVI